MDLADLVREITKVQDVLDKAIEYHAKINEANAALHFADRVLYSPLTSHLFEARSAMQKIRGDWEERCLAEYGSAPTAGQPGDGERTMPDPPKPAQPDPARWLAPPASGDFECCASGSCEVCRR